MRAIPVLLLTTCLAGCAGLQGGLSGANDAAGPLHVEAERLLDQARIDPLTDFLQRHASHSRDRDYQRIARERDSRCRAIGTRYARQPASIETLDMLRRGYARSCPEQVEAFARRVASRPAEQETESKRTPVAAQAQPERSSVAPGTGDCYLLYAIRNYQQGIPACESAAATGDPKAQHHLATMLRNQSPADSLRWARQSADRGHAPGQLLLAELYQQGQGVEADPVRALELLEAAARQGLAEAQYQTGMAWLEGVGTEADAEMALRWLERAAGQDETRAQLQLAKMYFGVSGPQQAAARQWLRRAASRGSASAQYQLGMSYLEGTGGPADPLEAYVWLSHALLNGERRAAAGVEQLAGQLSARQLEIARQRINDGTQGRY